MSDSLRPGVDPPARDRPARLLPGDWVRLEDSRIPARVVAIRGREATVEVASGLVRTNIARLERAEPPGEPAPSSPRVIFSGPAEDTLDLHGCTVADIEGLVVPFIDRAAARGLIRVTIVHGKGSGRLRKAVHNTLATLTAHGRVAHFGLADSWNGSWGATVVELV